MPKSLFFKRPDGSIREAPNGSKKEKDEVLIGVKAKPFQPGTQLASVLKKVGIKTCGGCAKRAQKLDQIWTKLTNKYK